MNGLIKAFSEANGDPSSMRLIVLMIIVVVLFNWSYHNITTATYTSLEYGDVLAMLGALGAKAYQKGKEADGNPEPSL